MHILIGLAMAAALLYFWLLGHWFARILVFLCLLGFPVILGLAVSADKNEAGAQIAGLVVFIISAVVVWLVASIPIYYWRYRLGCPSKLREYIEYERPARPQPAPVPPPARTPPPAAVTYETPAPWPSSAVLKMVEVSRHRSVDILTTYVRRSNLFREHAGAAFL